MSETNDAFGFDDLDLDTIPAKPINQGAPKSQEKDEDEGGEGSEGGQGGTAMASIPMPGMDDMNPDELLGDIKDSIAQMQEQMQSTYQQLNSTRLTGQSNDGKVKLTMTATYIFEDIEMGDDALDGGIQELKWRIREAFRDLLKKIQDRTQEQTMSLLQNMDIPDEIKNLNGTEDQGSEGQGS